jgi:hypothetical protein
MKTTTTTTAAVQEVDNFFKELEISDRKDRKLSKQALKKINEACRENEEKEIKDVPNIFNEHCYDTLTEYIKNYTESKKGDDIEDTEDCLIALQLYATDVANEVKIDLIIEEQKLIRTILKRNIDDIDFYEKEYRILYAQLDYLYNILGISMSFMKSRLPYDVLTQDFAHYITQKKCITSLDFLAKYETDCEDYVNYETISYNEKTDSYTIMKEEYKTYDEEYLDKYIKRYSLKDLIEIIYMSYLDTDLYVADEEIYINKLVGYIDNEEDMSTLEDYLDNHVIDVKESFIKERIELYKDQEIELREYMKRPI